MNGRATPASRLDHARYEGPLVLLHTVHLARAQTLDLIVAAEHEQKVIRADEGTLRAAIVELADALERVGGRLVSEAAGARQTLATVSFQAHQVDEVLAGHRAQIRERQVELELDRAPCFCLEVVALDRVEVLVAVTATERVHRVCVGEPNDGRSSASTLHLVEAHALLQKNKISMRTNNIGSVCFY